MSVIVNKPAFILGERLTERFKIYQGCEDILFGSFGETECDVKKNDDDNKIDSRYKPNFGLSFQCGVEYDIENMKRIDLGNVLFNKMLFLFR